MIERCEKHNPLVRDGTSQNQRLLKALEPSYVQVDERSLDDLLAFASRYAKQLQYYSSANQPHGDWREFIEYDISVIIALIANRDLTDIRFARERLNTLVEWKTLSVADLKGILSREFSLIFSMAAEMDIWYRRAVKGLRLETEVKRLITSQLAEAFHNAFGYYKCASDSNFLGPETDILFPIDDDNVLPPEEALQHEFHSVWLLEEVNEDNWESYLAAITRDCSVFEPAAGETLKRLYNGAEQLTTLLDTIYNAHAQIIHSAPDYLNESLSDWPEHEPHMALFLTFLQLFRHAQDHLNSLTKRHLEYYYREVLRLSRNEAEPDKVHVIFELAKQVDSHLVKAGTSLKAGKDAAGKDLFYRTDRDIVVNKASVAGLKSVHVDKDDNSRIYAAPVANSADGLGTEFEEEDAQWDTFGKSQRKPEGSGFLAQGKRTMQFAEVGFAVASSSLLLTQGTRTVDLKFTASTAPFQGVNKQQLTVQGTGEEGWFSVDQTNLSFRDGHKTLRVVLEPDDPPVIPYNADVHGGRYATELPMIRILLTNKADGSVPYAYETIRERIFTGLQVVVSVEGVTDLLLQNDFGLLDATKPFQPFGPRPSVGSRLYVGSREVFQKKLTSLSLNYEWQDVPKADLGTYYTNLDDSISNSSFKAGYDLLLDRTWEPLATGKQLFDTSDATQAQTNSMASDDFSDIDGYEADRITGELQEFTHDTARGFLRVSLTNPAMAFGHRDFRDAYTKAVIAYANDPTNSTKKNAIPNEPYTPVIERLTLGYSASESIHLSGSESSGKADPLFFHVTPFGAKVVRSGSEEPAYLASQFRYPVEGVSTHNQGELYIGLKDLEPRQNLSLLFQVAEGSVDPELPVQDVFWSYLKGNDWVPFEPNQILTDTTDGLLTSGIIRFDIPKEATETATILPADLHWLRASVPANAAAICDMIAIHAQAVQASFNDQDNDPGHLAKDLPAESIAKMENKDPDIKSVIQPYSSFDGEMREGDSAFNTRVSERLRHKNRGITIWDYERLVLEAFPSIYKVKCINHSTYNYTGDDLSIPASEFAPGFVTIIVIPDLQNKNAVNPLEPRASLGTLQEIHDTIAPHISPFAAERLKVINPLYEKVQVEFTVVFRSGYDRGHYETQLNEDIIEFLSPWVSGTDEEIVFGGQLHKSVILNFVEERPYVDYVSDFRMHQFNPATPGETSKMDIPEAVASTARTVFVSHKQHQIGE
ncbi:MAG: baseplate J/gp47 family protein [Candidatus Marinimicrobia bacterium]|nr:baseplate J/gp47 family protein [Candidatus Neomarinimicrobiota bacterium]MCF7880862.1 baseplate J/gp47 family protein [Candidatus Neomarinimicrobiota bacterium]